ncbi:hypothetical protein PFISCL1PPCAC_17613, partial [Pristionchus fissidentatus]
AEMDKLYLIKTKEAAAHLFEADRRPFSAGLLTLDGQSLVVFCSFLNTLAYVSILYVLPEVWLSCLIGIAFCSLTVFAVCRPRSALFGVFYYFTVMSNAVAGFLSITTLLAATFMPSDALIATVPPQLQQQYESAIPYVRLILISICGANVFLCYISTAAVEHIKRANQMQLPK